MGIKERKERERDEHRELILTAASEIITDEGFENLSIRKIAKKIEYSPAIIYHYFHDKDDIINHIMKKGYQKIVSALSSVPASVDIPLQRLKELTQKYIDAALQMPDEYMAVLLNKSPDILKYTSSLFKGASGQKPALGILTQCLKDIYKDKDTDDSLIELTAQIISTATFGLIIRLIIEKEIGEEQREKLIEHYIEVMVDGMVLGVVGR
jgi:AcrR family transcriptional regulator